MASFTIDGKKIEGNQITIADGKCIVDGKEVPLPPGITFKDKPKDEKHGSKVEGTGGHGTEGNQGDLFGPHE